MSSLEADYNSGKISREKYTYFRSKYEDKLNSIDAVEATRRIRSMQGKSTAPKNRKRSRKPTVDKKKQEQDKEDKYRETAKKREEQQTQNVLTLKSIEEDIAEKEYKRFCYTRTLEMLDNMRLKLDSISKYYKDSLGEDLDEKKIKDLLYDTNRRNTADLRSFL